MALTETKHDSEVILSEANGTRSREVVTIKSGSGKIYAGDVLGKITASGKYQKSAVHAGGGDDGSGTAIAVALQGVDATSGDVSCVVMARDGEVMVNGLGYATDVNDNTKKAAKWAMLKDVGIIVR